MKRERTPERLPRLLFLFALLAIPLPGYGQAPGSQVPDRYIVQLHPGQSSSATAASHGLTPDAVFSSAVNGFAGIVPAGRLRALRNDPRVLSVVPDRVVSANPKGGGGKPDNPGGGGGSSGGGGGEDPPQRDPEEVPAGVARIGASPGQLPYSGANIGIASIDTGLDFDHPDLNIGTPSFKAVAKGRKITTDESATAGRDNNGHGTHTGGTAAAKLDGFDVVGVAYGAVLYAVKVLDKNGRGYDSTVILGLDWIAANANSVSPKIRVANLSLGRPGSLNDNPAYRAAIQTLYQMGISISVSAGNDCDLEVSQQVPATYPEVLAVASSTALEGSSDISFTIAADTASYFASDGEFDNATGIGTTISAPGERQENISGGYAVSVGILSCKLGGGTTRFSGSSMSAPHVAGVAALLLEQAGGELDPELVRAKIMFGASRIHIAPLDSPTACYTFDLEREGILDAGGALAVSLP